jgi:hypothetical protein
MNPYVAVRGQRFISKDGDIVEGVGAGTLRGMPDKAVEGLPCVAYRDIDTNLLAVRTVASFNSIYTLCSHGDSNLEVRGSFVVCKKCRMNFGVD